MTTEEQQCRALLMQILFGNGTQKLTAQQVKQLVLEVFSEEVYEAAVRGSGR